MNVSPTTTNTNENVRPQLHPKGCDLHHQERKGNGLSGLTQIIPRPSDITHTLIIFALVFPWLIGVNDIGKKVIMPAIASISMEVN